MNGLRASVRRPRPGPKAAALWGVLVLGAVACGAPPATAEAKPAPVPVRQVSGTAPRPAATQPSAARSSGPGLEITHALRTYYLPRPTGSGPADHPTEYQFFLQATGAAPGKDPAVVKDVKVAFDLSAFRGKAKVGWVNKPWGCARSGDRLTCSIGDVELGAGFTPFQVDALPDAPKGPAGPMEITVTSANAPTVRRTAAVVIGAPRLTARQDKPLTGVPQGSEVRLTPAFGNQGDTDVDDDVLVKIVATDATLRPEYRNCRYDKPVAPTRAECTFPGPLRAGTAYETAGPLTGVVGADAMHGDLTYTVYRAHDRWDEGFSDAHILPPSAVRGTGAALGLRPVDGSGDDFRTSGNWNAELASGKVAFDTDRINDVQAVPFTIKGAVGAQVEVTVPWPRNYGEGDVRVVLPEGVRAVRVDPQDRPSEMTFCEPADGGARCPWGQYGTTLTVRIDKRVDGARGTVFAPSDPRTDPDQENNSAPVTVEYTG
ncbi:hypothetical protein MUU72_10770 [Streptomyces sp. RS10V-4]|uniref:hypothetical protein n=1 Tax=Streptomyces rhizoryzae TaxID=2932493 RepID=UPI002004D33D|nr:hypothetical protein [Streptomyces rhizoryzae]MCK7623570.1 hypothetical protein [Streptomyces rhizoryzae]